MAKHMGAFIDVSCNDIKHHETVFQQGLVVDIKANGSDIPFEMFRTRSLSATAAESTVTLAWRKAGSCLRRHQGLCLVRSHEQYHVFQVQFTVTNLLLSLYLTELLISEYLYPDPATGQPHPHHWWRADD